jgi:hypothetical protein
MWRTDDVVGTTQESNVTSADGLFIEMISAESNGLVATRNKAYHNIKQNSFSINSPADSE